MELIKIYNGSLVNARELHQFLKVKTRFNDWIKARIKKYQFRENQDFFSSQTSIQTAKGEQKALEYLITITMAKELAMVENNDQGRAARQYFIHCEETLQVLKHSKRFEAFFKLEATKERLRQNVENIGGSFEDYLQVDLAGRKILFNGSTIADEELPTLTLKGRDFATELTNVSLSEKEHTIDSAKQVNEEQHERIRKAFIDGTGKKPEDLPAEDKIKKLGEE